MTTNNTISMSRLCLILTIITLPLAAWSQRVNDSITLYIENRVEMQLIVLDYEQLKEDSIKNKISRELTSFQKHLKTLNASLKADEAELILFDGEEELSISPRVQKEIYLLQEGELKRSGVRDKAILSLTGARVILTANDLSKLQDLPLVHCFEQMVAQLPEKSRYAKSLFFECIDKAVVMIEEKEELNSRGDVLELTLGGGAHLYKGNWLGEIGFRLSTKFFDKDVLKFNPYLSTNILYDFRNINSPKINTFLNLGFQWDRSRGKDEPNLFGVELGYLISRNGDLFEKNTSRIGMLWSPVDGVVVSPQMYIIGGFEKVQPGLRIGFGL